MVGLALNISPGLSHLNTKTTLRCRHRYFISIKKTKTNLWELINISNKFWCLNPAIKLQTDDHFVNTGFPS